MFIPVEQDHARELAEMLMYHSYTRVDVRPVEDDPATEDENESIDPYGAHVRGPDAATVAPANWDDRTPGTAGLMCFFAWRDRRVNGLTQRTPTLMVPFDDGLRQGDLVRNVLDQDGNTLLAGPACVEVLDPMVRNGPSSGRLAWLEATEG